MQLQGALTVSLHFWVESRHPSYDRPIASHFVHLLKAHDERTAQHGNRYTTQKKNHVEIAMLVCRIHFFRLA